MRNTTVINNIDCVVTTIDELLIKATYNYLNLIFFINVVAGTKNSCFVRKIMIAYIHTLNFIKPLKTDFNVTCIQNLQYIVWI